MFNASTFISFSPPPPEYDTGLYRHNDTIKDAYIKGTSIFIFMESGDTFEFSNYNNPINARVDKVCIVGEKLEVGDMAYKGTDGKFYRIVNPFKEEVE